MIIIIIVIVVKRVLVTAWPYSHGEVHRVDKCRRRRCHQWWCRVVGFFSVAVCHSCGTVTIIRTSSLLVGRVRVIVILYSYIKFIQYTYNISSVKIQYYCEDDTSDNEHNINTVLLRRYNENKFRKKILHSISCVTVENRGLFKAYSPSLDALQESASSKPRDIFI